MNIKIAALVILYNYDDKTIHNIKSYIDSVDIVFAYDNSTKKNRKREAVLKELEKIHFIDGCGNQGISHAINIVADIAIGLNYNWLITFDQDSVASEGMIQLMQEYIESCSNVNQIGILSPTIRNELVKFKKVQQDISYADWVIQSGAMHNLDAFRTVKGYDENLFIDQVDIEYCIRLRLNKFRISVLNYAVLLHNTLDDDVKLIYRKGRKMYLNKYTPVRYYYVIRNNLYCAKKYKKSNPQYYAQLKRNLVVQMQTLVHEKEKISRLKAVIYGYIDYKTGRMGKVKRKLSK